MTWPPSNRLDDIFHHSGFRPIPYPKPLSNNNKMAAHVLFYAKTESTFFDGEPFIALVNMQMRFDGTIGFPGGFIDPGEDIITGLNRELVEEIDLNSQLYIGDVDFNSAYINENDVELYFFVKEISIHEFQDIEKDALHAKEFGLENMGNIRVPLYQMNEDKSKGFPQFLKNQFVGNAKQQLLYALYSKQLIDIDYCKKCLNS